MSAPDEVRRLATRALLDGPVPSDLIGPDGTVYGPDDVADVVLKATASLIVVAELERWTKEFRRNAASAEYAMFETTWNDAADLLDRHIAELRGGVPAFGQSGYELTLLFSCDACGDDSQRTFITSVPVIDTRYRACQSCCPTAG